MDKVEFLQGVKVHDGFTFEKEKQYRVIEDDNLERYFVFTGKGNEVTSFSKSGTLGSVFIDVEKNLF